MIVQIEVADDVRCEEFEEFLVKLEAFCLKDDVRPLVKNVSVEPSVLSEVRSV